MLSFALKKKDGKKCIFEINCERWKKCKKITMLENHALSISSSFLKKLSSTQILASEKGPKSTHFLMHNFVIKLEKIYKDFPDFN